LATAATAKAKALAAAPISTPDAIKELHGQIAERYGQGLI
jgi:hypothetical protein